MEDLKSFIKLLATKSGMFTINRIEDLYLMLNGYLIASNNRSYDDFILSFNDFVLKKYKIEEDVHWCRLIRFYSGSDSHSLELFRSLFDEFLSKKGNS